MKPDYRLCNQTVTVYNRYATVGGVIYKKALIKRAFFDFTTNYGIDKQGLVVGRTFVLVIPQCEDNPRFVFPQTDNPENPNTYTLQVGSKVLLGEGEDIRDEVAWQQLIPARNHRLVVVKNVDPKFYEGEIVHVERGG